MAKSDTWPGGVAMESLSNMDSAGSCDSVISVNSGFVSSPGTSYLWPTDTVVCLFIVQHSESIAWLAEDCVNKHKRLTYYTQIKTFRR